jgi:hypothetical protein
VGVLRIVSYGSEGGRVFSVGVLLRNVAGGGHLVIAPGHVELRPGRLSKKISHVDGIRQEGTDAIMYWARAMPPWMNVSVVVSDGSQTGLATGAFWMRRRLKSALQGAGFQVTERVTWFERGNELMTFWYN